MPDLRGRGKNPLRLSVFLVLIAARSAWALSCAEGFKMIVEMSEGSPHLSRSVRQRPADVAEEALASLHGVPTNMHAGGFVPTAKDINKFRQDWRQPSRVPYSGDRHLQEITYNLAKRAPRGGWTEKDAFLADTDYLFEKTPEGQKEQEEAWRVYDRVRRDRRTPLIGKYETYQLFNIDHNRITSISADGKRVVIDVDTAAKLSEAEVREVLESVAWSEAEKRALRDTLDLARNFQWLYSESWTPVINDFYVLGIIHGHKAYQFIPYGGAKPDSLAATVRSDAGTGHIALTTLHFERAQLFPWFDASTFAKREKPMSPYFLNQ